MEIRLKLDVLLGLYFVHAQSIYVHREMVSNPVVVDGLPKTAVLNMFIVNCKTPFSGKFHKL